MSIWDSTEFCLFILAKVRRLYRPVLIRIYECKVFIDEKLVVVDKYLNCVRVDVEACESDQAHNPD